MSSDRTRGNFADADTLIPPLRQVNNPMQSEGLTYTLRGMFRTGGGVPGYVFDVADGPHTIGEATLLITSDRTAVERIGHMGCELRPEFRKRGYVPRLARGLFPFVREHGLRELLITCDVGHVSQRQSIMELGAVALDQIPAAGDDAAKERFLLSVS